MHIAMMHVQAKADGLLLTFALKAATLNCTLAKLMVAIADADGNVGKQRQTLAGWCIDQL